MKFSQKENLKNIVQCPFKQSGNFLAIFLLILRQFGGHFEGKLGIFFSEFNDFLLCSVLI